MKAKCFFIYLKGHYWWFCNNHCKKMIQ